MSLYTRLIDTRYGTWRGMVRLALADLRWLFGGVKRFTRPDFDRVERLVFVCLGNVCRSPYAQRLAEELGVPTASFGLSTHTGGLADADARRAAQRAGRSLDGHRAVDMKDFGVRDGDLLLVMEVGQAIRLRDRLDGSRAQVALLGLWAHPFRIHIHDPVTLSDAYFDTCYALLETAVKGVVREWRAVDRSSNGRDSAG